TAPPDPVAAPAVAPPVGAPAPIAPDREAAPVLLAPAAQAQRRRRTVAAQGELQRPAVADVAAAHPAVAGRIRITGDRQRVGLFAVAVAELDVVQAAFAQGLFPGPALGLPGL